MSTQSSGGFDVTAAGNTVQDKEGEGVWVNLRDVNNDPVEYEKDGEKRPLRILVAGTYSKQYRDISDRQRNKLLKTRRMQLTGDQLRENQREASAHCCIAWEGFHAAGKEFACNPTNAMAVFKAAPWFQEQVEEQMQDHESFFRNASSV